MGTKCGVATTFEHSVGDALPGAVQVFAKALGITEAQLFKQMETGQVLAAETLPKVAAAYREAALEGGAYGLALKGLRVTEGQMIKASQEAGDTIFKSGFSSGLAELYKSISELLKDSGPQLEKIGKIFGAVFKGIAHTLRLIEPVIKLFIDNFELMFGLGALSSIKMMERALKSFAFTANVSLAKAFFPITAALAAVEELMSLMSDNLVGVTESVMGNQFNILTGKSSSMIEKNGKFTRGEEAVDEDSTGKVAENIYGFFQKMKDAPLLLKPSVAAMHGIGTLSDMLPSFGSSSPTTQTTQTKQTVEKIEMNFTGIPVDIANELQEVVHSAFAPNSG